MKKCEISENPILKIPQNPIDDKIILEKLQKAKEVDDKKYKIGRTGSSYYIKISSTLKKLILKCT